MKSKVSLYGMLISIAAIGCGLVLSHADAQAADLQQRGVRFSACASNAALECGSLTLPVDYGKPSVDSFDMAVIRARATRPDKRLGVLLYNPGGPGGSGVDFVSFVVGTPVFARLRERFDIVSFDPRGIGRSRPVLCETPPRTVPHDPDHQQLATFLEGLADSVADACLQQNGLYITSLSTNNVARDMDALRQALGEKQITYLGPSYGSKIGAVYASLFPSRVRAMVLDGSVAAEHRDYLVEFVAEAMHTEQLALQRLDTLCRKDAACVLRDSGVIASLDAVTGYLQTTPVVAPDGRTLTAAGARGLIGSWLGDEASWPLIPKALAAAMNGNFLPFLPVARLPGTPFTAPQNIPEATRFTAFTAVMCNDFGTRRPASQYIATNDAAVGAASQLNERFYLAAAVAMCSAWPKADLPVIRNVRHLLKTPIVVLGVDFDTASPLSWSRNLAGALGMGRSVIRYEGSGHTAFPRANSDCINQAVESYLYTLAVPKPGFSCAAEPIGF